MTIPSAYCSLSNTCTSAYNSLLLTAHTAVNTMRQAAQLGPMGSKDVLAAWEAYTARTVTPRCDPNSDKVHTPAERCI
eukprot:3875773-Prymnesium_polylepis.1